MCFILKCLLMLLTATCNLLFSVSQHIIHNVNKVVPRKGQQYPQFMIVVIVHCGGYATVEIYMSVKKSYCVFFSLYVM